MTFRFLFAVALSGCGGAPFEILTGEAIDAQTEQTAATPADDAAPGPDTSSGIPTIDSGASDVAVRVDGDVADGGLVDASVCTSFSDTATPDPMHCAGTYVIPDVYAEVDLFPGDPACNPAMTTPPECRCRETYDCMCIVAMAGCAQGTLVSCDDSSGMPTLTCR